MLSKSYKLVTALLLATYVTTGAYASGKVKKKSLKKLLQLKTLLQ